MTWKHKLAQIPLASQTIRLWRKILPKRTPLIIEHMEVDLIFSRLSAKSTLQIIDVGAHHGEFLDIFERHNDEHAYQVICVEPFAENLKVLRAKARLCKRTRVQVCEVALSDVSGPKTFYAGSASTLFTCTPEWQTIFPDYFAHPRQIIIPCLTFADLFARYQIAPNLTWDLIKVDTEGHDLNVLRSMCAARVFPFAVMSEIGHDLASVAETIALLRANQYDEFYVFGRSGIATTFIGEYQTLEQLHQLRASGKLDAGNLVAFRAAV